MSGKPGRIICAVVWPVSKAGPKVVGTIKI
jgi:hypothetical protein